MRRPLIFLSLIFLAACQGREPSKPSAVARTGMPYVALVDLEGGAPEQPASGLMAVAKRDLTFDQLLRQLSQVQNDPEAKGVVVRFGGEWGLARAKEVGLGLAEVRKKGIPVHCHGNGFGNATYMTAAMGCNKIVVAPAGELETVGIAAQIVYLHKFLAEELKISIDILQVGKFKGAEEPLTRDGPSPEARASLEGYLADVRGAWIDAIRTGRESAVARVEDGPYGPVRGKAVGLVDEIGYFDDVVAELKATLGVAAERKLFGRGTRTENDSDFGEVLRTIAGTTESRGPIALVRATGSIGMGGGGPLSGDSGIAEDELSPVLKTLEEDDSVKGVVLRIDSPGGSALASDLIWHRLMQLRKKKPLVVSVGEMAASGGFYLASAANFILADRESLLGSIGVVGGKVGFGPALERFGIHGEVFPAKVGDPVAGRRAAYSSPLFAWDDETRTRVRETMGGVYDLFLARICEGRQMQREKVAESAEGKIFGGDEALRRGLVDQIGGLRDAYKKAKELAKLSPDAVVHVIESKPNPVLEFLGGTGASASAKSVSSALISSGVISASTTETASRLWPLLRGEKSIVALPYDVKVR